MNLLQSERAMQVDGRRREMLLSGLTAGALLLFGCESGKDRGDEGKFGQIGDAVVPSYTVNLSAYGGVPGAKPPILINAFRESFADLKKNGGGVLLVPPGVYDFGSYAEATSIISVNDMRNVAVSAYGATFKARTTASVMPHMFYFFNFENITIAGARFIDSGFVPWVNWRGMHCVGIQSDKPSSRFRLVDCHAEHVVGLFATNNNAGTRQYLADISIHGKVQNAYYGVGASFIREKVRVDLVCHNVRRAFIAYALKDANITVAASSTSQWPGSNGFIALVSAGASQGNVENVRVRVNASGAGIYAGYIHFYHQGPDADGYMRDIDATVNVNHVSMRPSLFLFSHEVEGVRAKTTRVWDRIHLRGRIRGDFDGRVVSSPSVSTGPGRIFVEKELAVPGNLAALPAYFHSDYKQRNGIDAL